MQHQHCQFILLFFHYTLHGHKKFFNTKTALLNLEEKWKQLLDKNGFTENDGSLEFIYHGMQTRI